MDNSVKSNTSLIERKFDIVDGLKSFGKDSNISNVSTGIIGGLTIGLVAIPIIISACQSANVPPEIIETWVFSTYFFGALVGVVLALGYKLPIAGAWSIPGMFAIAQVLGNFTMQEAVGAFLVSGIIVLVLGLTGWISKLVQYIPQQVMNAMVAGVLFGWAAKMIPAFQNEPIISLVGVVGYFISFKFLKKVPPVLGTFILGLIAVFVVKNPNINQITFGIASPMIFTPHFSVQAIISISIPLALLIICAENMQAIGVLKSIGYNPPVNRMTVLSGIGGLVAPWFGGHNANIAGPMTAFTAAEDAGPVECRYVASVWNGILFGALGIFAPLSVSLIGILPVDFINLLVGLVLMGTIIGGFQGAFGSNKFNKGAFICFVISMSGISLLGIGSAFWALVIGCAVSLVFEKNDYMEFIEQDLSKTLL